MYKMETQSFILLACAYNMKNRSAMHACVIHLKCINTWHIKEINIITQNNNTWTVKKVKYHISYVWKRKSTFHDLSEPIFNKGIHCKLSKVFVHGIDLYCTTQY